MKRLYWILSWLLALGACTTVDEPSIDTQQIILSKNRHINAPKKVTFFNSRQQRITPDQFNQLLADGTCFSEQRLGRDGSEEVHLINIADYSAKLEGTVLPYIQLTDLNGRQYSNADLKGKVIVMSFWCTNSQWCVGEMTRLDALAKRYSVHQNMEWIAPSLDPSLQLSHFLQEYSWSYTFIPDQQPLAKQLGITAFPTHLIINQDGVVAKAIVRDSNSPAALQTAVDRLL